MPDFSRFLNKVFLHNVAGNVAGMVEIPQQSLQTNSKKLNKNSKLYEI